MLSSRQVANNGFVIQTTVLSYFKKEKLHPYKFQYVQELTENDLDHRL